MRINLKTGIFSLLFLLCITMFESCASLRAGLYLSSIDSYNGSEVLQNEPRVKAFLETVLLKPKEYTMRIFTRRSIAAEIPITKLLHHEFYAINNSEGEYHTISFYGTDMKFYSEGAWILDGDSDFTSLKSFLDGENSWKVTEIKIENGIHVEMTILNIIKKMESDVTYYYRDHIKNKPNMDNCITAIEETYVENE